MKCNHNVSTYYLIDSAKIVWCNIVYKFPLLPSLFSFQQFETIQYYVINFLFVSNIKKYIKNVFL